MVTALGIESNKDYIIRMIRTYGLIRGLLIAIPYLWNVRKYDWNAIKSSILVLLDSFSYCNSYN